MHPGLAPFTMLRFGANPVTTQNTISYHHLTSRSKRTPGRIDKQLKVLEISHIEHSENVRLVCGGEVCVGQ